MKTEPKMYVYLLTFLSGKSYVGITSDTHRRIKEHRLNANRGTNVALSNAICKYGEPVMEVLHEVVGRAAAARLEVLEIKERSTLSPGGYNSTTGGEISFELSQEVRDKISACCIKRLSDPDARAKQGRTTRQGQMAMSQEAKDQHRQQTSRASKKMWQDPEYKEKTRAAMIAGNAARSEANKKATREKQSVAAKARWAKKPMSQTSRDKISKAQKARWAFLLN